MSLKTDILLGHQLTPLLSGWETGARQPSRTRKQCWADNPASRILRMLRLSRTPEAKFGLFPSRHSHPSRLVSPMPLPGRFLRDGLVSNDTDPFSALIQQHFYRVCKPTREPRNSCIESHPGGVYGEAFFSKGAVVSTIPRSRNDRDHLSPPH
jgi:hypothetical protein